MINPEYLNKLKEFCSTEREITEGLFFGFLVTYRDEFPDLESYMLDGNASVFPYDKFQEYAINLCKKNVDTRKTELIVPLFGYTSTSEFDEFMVLLGDYHLDSKGHINNPLSYSILEKDDKKAFQEIKTRLGNDYNRNRLAIVISNYYETTQYAKKLGNYLTSGDAFQDYKKYTV